VFEALLHNPTLPPSSLLFRFPPLPHPPLTSNCLKVWLVEGRDWSLVERHSLDPGERGTCLTAAVLKPPLAASGDGGGDAARQARDVAAAERRLYVAHASRLVRNNSGAHSCATENSSLR